MAKRRGRPPKYHSMEEIRQAQNESSKKYYDKNAELISQRAKLKRQQAKEELDSEK